MQGPVKAADVKLKFSRLAPQVLRDFKRIICFLPNQQDFSVAIRPFLLDNGLAMRVRVLGVVLAGGKGTRLYPLTKERAKPAVPFGGKYRIIDFVLSNFINSGIYSMYVLTQFRSQSLLQHLNEGWQFGNMLRHQFIIPVPAQMRSPGETWYQGTADAIYQNINLLEQAKPEFWL